MSGGNVVLIDSNGQPLKRPRCHPARTLSFDDIYLGRKKGIPAPTRMIRREALHEAGGFHPNIVSEDLYIAFKLTSLGYVIGMMGDILAYYRDHDANISKSLEPLLDGVLATYDCFPEHPRCEQMKARHMHRYLRRAVREDKQVAKRILKRIPLTSYNLKTIKACLQLCL